MQAPHELDRRSRGDASLRGPRGGLLPGARVAMTRCARLAPVSGTRSSPAALSPVGRLNFLLCARRWRSSGRAEEASELLLQRGDHLERDRAMEGRGCAEWSPPSSLPPHTPPGPDPRGLRVRLNVGGRVRGVRARLPLLQHASAHAAAPHALRAPCLPPWSPPRVRARPLPALLGPDPALQPCVPPAGHSRASLIPSTARPVLSEGAARGGPSVSPLEGWSH